MRTGSRSRSTSRWIRTGPSRLQPCMSTTTVRSASDTGRSLRSSKPRNGHRASRSSLDVCARIRRSKSINPSRFRSSRLCSGSSRIAVRSGSLHLLARVGLDLGRLGVAGDGIGRQAAAAPSRPVKGRVPVQARETLAPNKAQLSQVTLRRFRQCEKRASPRSRGTRPHGTSRECTGRSLGDSRDRGRKQRSDQQ
jgi:hypothetical protein